MKPIINGDNIRVLVIKPMYSTHTRDFKIAGKRVKDADGNKIKEQEEKFEKEIYLKTWMEKRDIVYYGEYLGSSGTKLKTRSEIYNRLTQQFYHVAHSVEEMKDALQPKRISRPGFKPDQDEI